MDHKQHLPLTQLLDGYGLDCDRPETFRAAWQLADDGYIHAHLVEHLAQRNQPDCIGLVLNAETANGKNGWFQAREVLGQTEGFLADVERWHSLLRAQNRVDQKQNRIASNLGAEIRSVLMLCTLRSRTLILPAELLQQLLRFGIWKPEQALAYVRGITDAIKNTDEIKQGETLTAILPYLPFAALPEALEIVRGMKNEWPQTQALSAIAAHLPAEQQPAVFQEALEIARGVERGDPPEPFLCRILCATAVHFPPEQRSRIVQEALDIARRIQDDEDRYRALAEVVPYLVLEEALEVAREISHDFYRFRALAEISRKLPPEQAFEVVHRIEDGLQQRRALIAILHQLPPDLLQKALEWESIQGEEEQWTLLRIQAALALHLPPEQALEIARTMQKKNKNASVRLQAATLFAVAHKLPSEKQAPVFQEALEIVRNGRDRFNALADIAPYLTLSTLPDALEIAGRIRDTEAQYQALAAIVPHLLSEQALAVAHSIPDKWQRSEALARIVSQFPPEQALEIARTIDDKGKQSEALSVIARDLSPEQRTPILQEALAAARECENEWNRVQALTALVPMLTPALLPEALEIVRGIPNATVRCEGFAALAPALSPEQHSPVMQEAFTTARAIEEDEDGGIGWFHAVCTLAPHLPPDLLQEALVMAQGIANDWNRSVILAAIAPHLPPEQALQIVRNIPYDSPRNSERSHVLQAIAPQFPPEQALELAGQMQNPWMRSQTLRVIAPKLPPGQALEVARGIENDYERCLALASLVPDLPLAQRTPVLWEALAIVPKLPNALYRSEALSALSDQYRYSSEPLAFAILDAVAGEQRADAMQILARLSPALQELSGDTALLDTVRAIEDVTRWWP